jgi:hypothetical protein
MKDAKPEHIEHFIETRLVSRAARLENMAYCRYQRLQEAFSGSIYFLNRADTVIDGVAV